MRPAIDPTGRRREVANYFFFDDFFVVDFLLEDFFEPAFFVAMALTSFLV
jgi:hypothetical protein